jgi:hypothetical protein
MKVELIKRLAPIVMALAAVGSEPALARWADWPPGPTDAELEQVVRVAYSAAAAYARANTNYFARDGVFDPLRSAVEDELGRQGLTFVNVVSEPVADLDAARACASEGTELRIGVNIFGDGIDLAAATDDRVFSYHYEPRDNAAVVVAPAAACGTP